MVVQVQQETLLIQPPLYQQSHPDREVLALALVPKEVDRLLKMENRQARNQSPEPHLTIPFLPVQVKVVASTGVSNLDPEPRVLFHRLNVHLSLLRLPLKLPCMSVRRVLVKVLFLLLLFQLLHHRVRSERNQMLFRRGS